MGKALPTIVIGALVALAGLPGCGDEPVVEDFATTNEEGFLTACAQPIDDPRLVSDVCRCVYDRIEDETSYDDFATMDLALSTNPTAALPDELVEAISDCFAAESGLADG